MPPTVRGREVEFRLKTAAAIAQASGATGWQSFHAYSENFQPGESTVADNEIGGTRHNNVDPVPMAPGLANPTGAMRVALDRAQIGFWLASLLGAPTTTGSAPNYTHVFTSGGVSPIMRHIEIPMGSMLSKMCDAWLVSQLSLSLGDEDGYKGVDLTTIGRSVRSLAAALGTTPTAAPARDKVRGSAGLIKINGIDFGNALGGRFDAANGAFFERYVDNSEWPAALEVGESSVTCSPEVRMRTDSKAVLDLFDGVTPFTFELLFELNANQSLSFLCPHMTAPRVLPAAGGTGLMSVSPVFTAAQKISAPTAPMLTVTLKNQVASYA